MPTFTGHAGADTISATLVSKGVIAVGGSAPGDGADTLIGGGGSDLLSSAGGDDLIVETASPRASTKVLVDGGGGLDRLDVTGPPAASTLTFGPGSGEHFLLDIAAASSRITLDMVGVEELHVAAGQLTAANITGAPGANSLILLQSGSQVIVEGANVPAMALNNLSASAALAITTGASSDFIDATRMGFAGHTQVIHSGGGADTLFVNNSVVDAGAGDDAMVWFREGGADTLDGGAGSDSFTASTGGSSDAISLSATADGHVRESLNGLIQDLVHVETLSIAAGDRDDAVRIGDLSTTDVRTVNVDLTGTSGGPDGAVDTITFAAGSADIGFLPDGSTLDVSMLGKNGVLWTTLVTNLDPTDRLAFNGAADADLYRFHEAVLRNATFDLGEGNDVIEGGLIAGSVSMGDGDDFIGVFPGSHDNRIDMGAGDDEATDTGSFDQLAGGTGADTLTAIEQNGPAVGDTLLGGDGNDALFLGFGTHNGFASGGAGDDTIDVIESDQTASGDAGNDIISLDAFRSTASGGDGNDLLITTDQFGALTLRGDAGDDHFQFGLTFEHSAGDIGPLFDGGTGTDVLDVIPDPNFTQDGGIWTDTITTQTNAAGQTVAELQTNHDFVNAGHQVVHKLETTDATGVEVLNLAGGTGQDNFTLNDLTGTGVTVVRIDLGLNTPDGDVDRVTLGATAGADQVTITDFVGVGDLRISGLPESVLLFDMDDSSFADAAHDTVRVRTGAGDDVIDLSTQNFAHGVFVDSGVGNDTMIGGFGGATFVLDTAAPGVDRLEDFRGVAAGGNDVIQVAGTSTDRSFADMLRNNHIGQQGADVLIVEGQGELVLTNTSLASLTAADFAFNPFGI